MPSKAQWEYACRAGTTTPFHYGETFTTDLVNCIGNDTYNADPQGKTRRDTGPVGSFPANDWGLQDLHGNVWEWCEDHYHPNYHNAPDDGRAWIESDQTSTSLVLRGGSLVSVPWQCRSACRWSYLSHFRTHYVGFRVCCILLGD